MSGQANLHNATKVERTLWGSKDNGATVEMSTSVRDSYVSISIKDDEGNSITLFSTSPEAMFALTTAAAEAGTFLLNAELVIARESSKRYFA